jgi:hypothetical protein
MDRKEEEARPPDDMMDQMVVDLKTGKDITGEYVGQRLKELAVEADEIIERHVERFKEDPSKKMDIFKEGYKEIHERLGQGSIGPATAAAAPLMEEKFQKLADLLGLSEEELDDFYSRLNELW